MTNPDGWKMASVVFSLCLATVTATHAQMFKTLVNFDDTNGAYPEAMSLVQGTDGNFYGTTSGGGTGSRECFTGACGTVFKITRDGTLRTLYNFCTQPNCADGADPSGLILGTDGNFYGTTAAGGINNGGGYLTCYLGCGTVFKITPTGGLTTIYNFCSQLNCADGGIPSAGLAQGIDGNFYGVTEASGLAFTAYGTIFNITSSGALTTIYNFCALGNCDYYGYDMPDAALIQATDGSFYGTTFQSGSIQGFGPGTVFQITAKGTLATLYTFCSKINCYDGNQPEAGVMQAADGSFYGTTAFGGNLNGFCNNNAQEGCGTAFKITARGKLTTLYRFCSQPTCADGGNPYAGLVEGTDAVLYGAAAAGGSQACSGGCGTVFTITAERDLTTLHTFDSTDGAYPMGGLLQGTNGIFYGTTQQGGSLQGSCKNGQFIGCGTIFSLDMGLGPFVTFVRAAGKVGQTGGILGQGFTGTTSVILNGVAANFTVISDTYIKATVPTGATTGYVRVTTPTGLLTSNVPFHVIQ